VEDFRICSVDSFKSQFDYMFWENGNMFLLNGKPFLILFHISCGFLKYAWCIFKATQVSIYKLQGKMYENNLPNVKTYYHHIKITN